MSVVVVSGAPGTGKSTVADVLGLGDEAWSDRLGDASAELIFRLSPQFPSLVAEGWWRGERRTRAIREFAGALEVLCHCDPATAADRMRRRLPAARQESSFDPWNGRCGRRHAACHLSLTRLLR